MSIKKTLFGLGAALAALAVIPATGLYFFRRQIVSEVDELIASIPPASPDFFNVDRIIELPEPVQRYFKHVLTDGQPLIRFARLKQRGLLRGDKDQAWMPVNAEQYFVVDPPAFVWHARVSPLPFFWIEARDRYRRGAGNMLIKLYSTLTMANARGPEIDEASLIRFLGELVALPTALLGENIRWQKIDGTRAKAFLSDQGMTVEAVFHFNEIGEITHCVVKDRNRTVDGRYVPEQWTGYFRNYQTFDQIRIPTELEAAWNLAEGDLSYIRLTITEIEYNVAARY